MKLKVDLNRLTLDDMIAMEENRGLRTIRDIMARFVTGEDGEYLPFDEAAKILGKLNVNELKSVTEQFAGAVKGAQSAALPPTGSDR